MRTVPYRLRHLNTWSPGSGTVLWRGYEVSHCCRKYVAGVDSECSQSYSTSNVLCSVLVAEIQALGILFLLFAFVI